MRSLLSAGAHEAIMFALSGLQPDDTVSLKTALTRALRTIAVAIADVVGPALWGLEDESGEIRSEVRPALEYLFQVCELFFLCANTSIETVLLQHQALDIYIPLLADSSTQSKIAVCQLLASTMRIPEHRTVVTEWIPAADRMKESKGKRGWEKPALVDTNAPSRYGGWVVRSLSAMLRSRDPKVTI